MTGELKVLPDRVWLKESFLFSIYDSQYGYANQGKEYSESDYGSEYGMVENGQENNQNSAMGGRLAPSEYSQSHPGSTLNRSRQLQDKY